MLKTIYSDPVFIFFMVFATISIGGLVVAGILSLTNQPSQAEQIQMCRNLCAPSGIQEFTLNISHPNCVCQPASCQ